MDHSGKQKFDREIDAAYNADADSRAPANNATLTQMRNKIPTLKRLSANFGKNVKLTANPSVAYSSETGGDAVTYGSSANFDNTETYFYGNSFTSYRNLAHTMLHEFGHIHSFITHNFLNNFNSIRGNFSNQYKMDRATAMDEIYAHEYAFKYDGIPYKNTYSWQHNYNILH